MVKKTLRIFVLSLEIFIGLFAVYILYLISAMLVPVNSDYKYDESEIQFFVISNGVHTDICLPVKNNIYDWSAFVAVQDFDGVLDNPKYIGIGWGDKGFYLDTPTWADLKLSTAVNAIFLPSETAMHITYYQDVPKESEHVVRCSMSKEEYQNLITYVNTSFENEGSKDGAQLIAGKGYAQNDNFYEANGSYWGLKTCNTWVNEALKIAGVRTSFHALFEPGIMRWIH